MGLDLSEVGESRYVVQMYTDIEVYAKNRSEAVRVAREMFLEETSAWCVQRFKWKVQDE